MTPSYESSSVAALEEPSDFSAVVSERPSAKHVPSKLRGNGTLPVPAASRWELALVIGSVALLHAGGALAALNGHAEKAAAARPRSRVQIQVTRSVPATPALVPPPPLTPRPLPKQVTTPQRRLDTPLTHPQESALPVEQAPVDTGSSLPAAVDGTLFAGSGGLGTAAPPAPALPAPAPPPAAAPVIQAREGANYLKNPRPAYPSLARRQGWEGTTLLRVQVGPNGRPGAVSVQRSSGKSSLDDAAIEAVKKWTFAPATQGGAPIAGVVSVPIVFRLQ